MAPKKENILITGATGFVGRALTEKLLTYKRNLFLVSRNKNFKNKKAEVLHGDLSDLDFCQKTLSGIQTVFYLAGYKKNLAYHVKYASDFIAGNVGPLLVFLKALGKSSARQLIYLSSTHAGRDWEKENDGYAIAKYINELMLRFFAQQQKIEVKIIRSAPIYGPGDNFNPETANFVPSTIIKVSASKDRMTVWGSGTRKMQFIYIDDLVSNLMTAQTSLGNFYVVGHPQALSVNQVIKKIINLFAKKLLIEHDLAKPDKPTKLFNFNNLIAPKISFNEGLKRTLEYFRQLNG